MKKMQEYLSRDEERFLSLLAKTDNKDSILKEIRAELDRILYAYNEQDLSERMKEKAASLVSVARSAAELLDVTGESKIYSRKAYGEAEEKGRRSWLYTLFLFLALLILIAVCAYVYIYYVQFDDSYNSWILLGAVALSAILAYLAGAFSHRKQPVQKNDLYAEAHYDARKTYSAVYQMVLTIDKVLEETQLNESLETKKEIQQNKGGVTEDELNLLSQLLESAYGNKEDEAAREVIAEIKYYLHKKKIELQDRNSENDSWFEKMAMDGDLTLRPAMILDGVLLKKGLASGGR